MIAEVVYILCAATSFLSFVLLWRAHKRSKTTLLFWSSFCFMGFTIGNILLFVDLVLLPVSIDLSVVRTVPSVVGIIGLLYGMIWDWN